MMSRSNLRWAVIVFTAFTGLVHLYLGVTNLTGPLQNLGVLWLLDGIGYFVLLGGVLGLTPWLKNQKALSHYLLMGFAVVTIFAWVFMSGVLNGDALHPLAIPDKIDEVLLIIATFMHLRAS
jgi:hypothetical protein